MQASPRPFKRLRPVNAEYETKQEEFWAETYAEEYIRRNSEFDKELGCKAWETMLRKSEGVESLLECGCNIGRNLACLAEVRPQSQQSIIECSKPAFEFVSQRYSFAHALQWVHPGVRLAAGKFRSGLHDGCADSHSS